MRYLLTIFFLCAVVGVLVGVKFTQISTLMHFGAEMKKAGPPPESVSTSVAQDQIWESTLAATGTIAPAKGVAVSNDAPGIVSRIHFDSGALVHEGQVLVELDTSVERAQLQSLEARLALAKLTEKRSRALVESQSLAPAQLDTDEATLKSSTRDLGALEAQVSRKVVRAPFTGRLGIRQVNLGQYLTPGTTVSVLEAIDSVFVDFTLPQQRLTIVKVGMPVRATIEGLLPPGAAASVTDGGAPTSTTFDGAVAAIDPEVDPATRTIKLRASLPNGQETLRPGMFAEVALVLSEKPHVIAVPQTAVVHASYGDSVFVVEDKKDEAGAPVTGADGKPAKSARQQFVRLGESRGDFVSIVDGIQVGQEVVSAGAFKLRNGSGISIAPDVKAAPQLNPHPENH